MDLILNRYRNLTVLLVAILVQLVLLAYQVKSNQEVRLIRVWAVTAVTPLARVLENGRSGTSAFFKDYFVLLDVRERTSISRPIWNDSSWRISICAPNCPRRTGPARWRSFRPRRP